MTSRPLALFVSHSGRHCGVAQFGQRLHEILEGDDRIAWAFAQCDSFEALAAATLATRPQLLVLNYHALTLAWADTIRLRELRLPVFGIMHEGDQATADRATADKFDYWLCPDPTLIPRNPLVLPVPRFMPQEAVQVGEGPSVFTIGSFGFASPNKGFEYLCERVCAEFDVARIRLNIPFHDREDLIPRAQVEATVEACRKAVNKPGIELAITHDFLNEEALVRFLSANTINAFLYRDTSAGRGVASCTDFALASGRPIAISRSTMFRNLLELNPSICVEDTSLSAIATRGAGQLAPLRKSAAPRMAATGWTTAILEALATRAESALVPDGRGFNKILDDSSRTAYGDAVQLLWRHAPDMMRRKIERANIQQGFALDTVLRVASRFQAPRILAIGSYEDTCVATLRSLGYRLDEVDPNVNGLDLGEFYASPSTRLASYEILLCVSVLEHVAKDRAFVRMAADLLVPEGVAIFTVDFAEKYNANSRKPSVDHRLYTSDQLHLLMRDMLPDCALVDAECWREGVEDFEFEGCRYGFATWTFRRLDGRSIGRAFAAADMREAGELVGKPALHPGRRKLSLIQRLTREASRLIPGKKSKLSRGG